jgi:hypothetical protein
MSIRESLILDLRRELLGPRDGPTEILPPKQVPSSEYVTGVLVPMNVGTGRDPDAEDVSASRGEGDDDEGGSGDTMFVPGEVSPSLDPRLRPKSLGVSFLVPAAETSTMSLCATWARYHKDSDNWVRRPDSFILEGIPCAGQSQHRPASDPGVVIHLRSRRIGGELRVSVFLVNGGLAANPEKPAEEELVFQPEIRVRLSAGTHLVPMAFRGLRGDPEAESQSLLFRNRRHFARGHLVGAYWREVDPQRPINGRSGESNPFVWEDAVSLPSDSLRDDFRNPDVRTDYTPVFGIEAPDPGWRGASQPGPELGASVLAEAWVPAILRSALEPLVSGYEDWLRTRQERDLPSLAGSHLAAARKHLAAGDEAADRIRKGLDFLLQDDEARLAFCFMNKAMDIQRRWTDRASVPPRPLDWRPFQMAFILQTIVGLSDSRSPERRICDLLWFPTGGGKTEAYLGIAIYVLALRKLRGARGDRENTESGTGVLSRYTLRLLTIQQFRRALVSIAAAEFLRVSVEARNIGWRPRSCDTTRNHLWGGARFSIGLWVGAGVTPNNLQSFSTGPVARTDTRVAGAIDILRGKRSGIDHAGVRWLVDGEPAQVPQCPCCGEWLALGPDGLNVGHHRLRFVVRAPGAPTLPTNVMASNDRVHVSSISAFRKASKSHFSISVEFDTTRTVSSKEIDEWFDAKLGPALGADVRLVAARPSRPGYFIRSSPQNNRTTRDVDFELRCPNWESCETNDVQWWEEVPVPLDSVGPHPDVPPPLRDSVNEAFAIDASARLAFGMPIPAYTVDDQVYHRSPSMIVATVDKFARLPYEPRAAAMFGNITHFHSRIGYYRAPHYPRSFGENEHPHGFARGRELHRAVPPFSPPELIIQDELHLIEGPLGSMVGMYELLVEELASRSLDEAPRVVKYVASTATIRMAAEQVASLFGGRRVATFPPPILDEADSFFSHRSEVHPADSSRPGRAYIGICCPGRAQTMVITRVWAALLHAPFQLRSEGATDSELDRFWTLVGYFNSIRELAGALALYRQDIPERMRWRHGPGAREIDPDDRVQLSSMARSGSLPGVLERLQVSLPGQPPDSAFATSMFGTGVDVNRLGLMVVHGQPKTTSSYIQATGRVGRDRGGLVVAFFPASRPRDLDHYEHFVPFHLGLFRHVEPITVAPFSPGVMDRSIGPISVGLLRNAADITHHPVDSAWTFDGEDHNFGAQRMATHRADPEVLAIPSLFERRNSDQPGNRQVPAGYVRTLAERMLDRWNARVRLANIAPFEYQESTMLHTPTSSVVLGDEQHETATATGTEIVVVYERSPQSLRDVESTTTFGD